MEAIEHRTGDSSRRNRHAIGYGLFSFEDGPVGSLGGQEDHQPATPTLVDLRNIYREDDVVAAGLRYFSIGRASPADG